MTGWKKVLGFAGSAAALALALGTSAHAASVTLDFENDANGSPLVSGQIIDDEYAAAGIVITAAHPNNPSLDIAVIQDSGTTFEPDHRTPGFGPGNDTAEGNILIVPRNRTDADSDGLVDRPESQEFNPGGKLFFGFDTNYTNASITVIDDDEDEREGFLRAFLGGNQVAFVQLEALGNNSVQTVGFDGFEYDSLEVDFGGSGGLISLTASSSGANVVPTPSAAIAGLAGLGCLIMRRRRVA